MKREKMKRAMIILAVVLLTGAMAMGCPPVVEVEYPTRTITFIVPYSPGGMTDVSARMLAAEMEQIVGRPIIITNIPGAGGVVGSRTFVDMQTDPYTLLVSPSMALNTPLFIGAEPFDLDKLSFVGSYMPQERVLFAPIDAPFATFEEFIDYVARNPGEVSVGAGGSAWALEVMKAIAVVEGLDMTYVLFPGGAPASAAILGAHIDVTETGVGTAAFHAAKAGDLRILVNLGRWTVPHFPEVKNVLEKGYPFATDVEYGILMHGGVPEAIRQFWEDTLRTVMGDPEMVKKMEDVGFTPRFLPGSEWEKVVRDAIAAVPALKEFNKALEE